MRRRSNSAEIKATSEGPRVKIKVAILTKGAKRRLGLPITQVRMARGQFSKLAINKNHLKGFNKRCKAIRDKYEGMKINEVKNVWDECKSINDEMDGLVRVDTERWGLKDVLFE
nr:uncharacterized protein I203_01981 [Kwoniella mangroviensis CBS 8507]OCF68598.1 hypothetical protein I203_01981 [Kwoniella mangroviensis CBS 8507]